MILFAIYKLRHNLLKRFNAALCLILMSGISQYAIAQKDSINHKINWHGGLLIEYKQLRSNNFGNFNFWSAGVQFGYRSLNVHFAFNTYDTASFQEMNYLIGDREKRKRLVGGFNAGFTLIPYYSSKKIVQLIYKFDYYSTTVYVGTKTAYQVLPNFTGNRTYSFDDRYNQFLFGPGLRINIKDIIALQTTFQLGINAQSENNSHYLKYIYDSDFYKYRKKSNAFMLGVSLVYQIHCHAK